jgi:hypothetical protein
MSFFAFLFLWLALPSLIHSVFFVPQFVELNQTRNPDFPQIDSCQPNGNLSLSNLELKKYFDEKTQSYRIPFGTCEAMVTEKPRFT